MMTDKVRCPLCSAEDSILLREYKVAELSSRWLTGFGFDPFKKYSGLTDLSKLQCKKCALIFYRPELIGDEELYSRMMKFEWYHENNKWEFDEAMTLIEKYGPGRLLEIGCANGNFLEKVVGKVEYIEGVEINSTLVEKCRSANLNVSSKALHELNSKFDMIVLFQVLEHLGELEKTIRQMMNLLDKNGIIIISVPDPESFLKEIDMPILDLPPHHNTGWTQNTFNYLATVYRLQKIYYGSERMRFIHYRYYRKEKLLQRQQASGSHPETFTEKVFRAGQRFIQSKLYYWNYVMEKNKMTGQTHLVALRKTNE